MRCVKAIASVELEQNVATPTHLNELCSNCTLRLVQVASTQHERLLDWHEWVGCAHTAAVGDCQAVSSLRAKTDQRKRLRILTAKRPSANQQRSLMSDVLVRCLAEQ